MSLNVIEAAVVIDQDGFPFPQIATLSNGDYVIGDIYNTGNAQLDEIIHLHVFDPLGASVAEVTISEPFFTPGSLSIGGLPGGDFAVAWGTLNSGVLGTSVYTAAGDLVSSVDLSAGIPNNNFDPVVTPLANGGYALAWYATVAGTYDLVTSTAWAASTRPSIPAIVPTTARFRTATVRLA